MNFYTNTETYFIYSLRFVETKIKDKDVLVRNIYNYNEVRLLYFSIKFYLEINQRILYTKYLF